MCLLGTQEQFWTISRSFWTIFEQYFCLFREIYDEKRTRFFTFFVKFWTQRGHILTFFASNIGRDPPGTLRGLFGPFPSNFQTNNWQFQSIFLQDQNPSQISCVIVRVQNCPGPNLFQSPCKFNVSIQALAISDLKKNKTGMDRFQDCCKV